MLGNRLEQRAAQVRIVSYGFFVGQRVQLNRLVGDDIEGRSLDLAVA